MKLTVNLRASTGQAVSRVSGLHSTRRVFVGGLAASLALPGWSQNYPAKPIRLIVPSAAGGAGDQLGRLLSQVVSPSIGQPVIVDNRPGAGGMVGTDIVAKSAGDGYTVLMYGSPLAVHPYLYKKMPYNIETDFVPVSLVARFPNIVIVNPTGRVNSLAALLDLARKSPGEVTYSGIAGSSQHIAAELFAATANTRLRFIPYKSGPQALVDLIGGSIDVYFSSITGALSLVKSGKVKALAVTSLRRSPLVPDVPTLAETVMPGFDVTEWSAMLMPAKTPREAVEKMSSEVAAAMRRPDIREAFAKLGADPLGSTPEEFGSFLSSELKRAEKIVRERGIKMDDGSS